MYKNEPPRTLVLEDPIGLPILQAAFEYPSARHTPRVKNRTCTTYGYYDYVIVMYSLGDVLSRPQSAAAAKCLDRCPYSLRRTHL